MEISTRRSRRRAAEELMITNTNNRVQTLSREIQRALSRMPNRGVGTRLKALMCEWQACLNDLENHVDDAAGFSVQEEKIQQLEKKLWALIMQV